MSDADSRKQLGGALGKVPSGLFILTARHDDAVTGMLASWVQQCAFEPPQLTVAVKKGRDILAWLSEGAQFTLNILEENQTDLIAHFGRGFTLTEPAFTGLDVTPLPDSGPVLAEALAYLTCRVLGRFSAADHEILIAHVISGQTQADGHPMVHVRKSGFHY